MMFVSLGIGTVIAVALITAVSLLTSGSSNTGKGSSGAPSTNALVGTSVRGFSVSALGGGTVTSPWTSGHPSVLIFFASWCGPCQAEMPKVAAYLRSHNEGPVKVLGVDANDQRTAGRSFVRKADATFPVAFDQNLGIANGIFQLQALPDTVFVNARGVVTRVYIGAIPTSQLARGIRALESA